MIRSARVRALFALAVIAVSLYIAATVPVRLGLDLRGGTQIVLETRSTPTAEADRAATDRTLEVLRGRVDALGVAEPTLVRSGAHRIIVELPGVQDPKKGGRGARPHRAAHRPPGPRPGPAPRTGRRRRRESTKAGSGEQVLPDESVQRLRLAATAMTGEDVKGADARFDPETGAGWHVTVDFDRAGRERWAKLTGEAACRPAGDPARRVAIVLDGRIISAPQVDPSVACGTGIAGGSTQITGSFDDAEARELALLINGGALPVPVETVEQHTVGPTLGARAITASAWAAVIGTALTALFIIVVYRLMGVLAAVALLAYGLISYAALAALGATLTLPGLAGFVLAIGMAVDANVLVFERAREEYAARVRPTGRSALTAGFRNAFSAIADSNVTTLIAAGLLFFLASGPVRGFGVTLGIGVVASMISALVVTRVLADFAVSRAWVHRRPGVTGLATAGRVRAALARRELRPMRRPRRWLAASAVALVLAGSGIAVRGLDLGLEFTGGRMLQYDTGRAVDPERARTALADAGFPGAVVQTAGETGLTVRTGELTDARADAVTRTVGALGGGAEKVRDELIGPSLGEELRRGALISLGVALGGAAAVSRGAVPLAVRDGGGRRARARRGDPRRRVRVAGQAGGRGVPRRAADGDRLLGQRLGRRLRPRPGTGPAGPRGAAGRRHRPGHPPDPAAHGEHRDGRGPHPRLPGRPRRRLPDRLRPRPAHRPGGRHVLVGLHRLADRRRTRPPAARPTRGGTAAGRAPARTGQAA
ncbi:conserved hypothetical protein [Streptomyces sp. e14]|nr:conserved hypothetical protein [Streptomyces sp. e14]